MLLLILIPTYSLSSTKNTCTYLEPGYIQHQLGEIQTLLNKIHLQPHFKNGQAQGHKIVSIQKNSDLLQLKLQKNDIIKQINHRHLPIILTLRKILQNCLFYQSSP
ncbi:MAG: hypothetical protein JKY01_07795 [Pseudomonadales bacterium]|nr:hypothetical protein [Pseudomonadales bacterium]